MGERKKAARPSRFHTQERAAWNNTPSGRSSVHQFSPVVITASKRGKPDAALAKLVIARPLNEPVVAMAYRHRPCPDHVSLPPQVLEIARERSCQRWVVRDDRAGRCYGLRLPHVEAAGWLHESEGGPEWFVPLTSFQVIAWQTWPFVTDTIHVGLLYGSDIVPGDAVQGQLFHRGAV
jgi:hypothetical protein